MSFINRRTKAQFYNDSSITFFVQKDCVDIIFKVKRGVYLTVSVYSLSGNRLLLACLWDGFWNRLRHMNNRKDVIKRLEKNVLLLRAFLQMLHRLILLILTRNVRLALLYWR